MSKSETPWDKLVKVAEANMADPIEGYKERAEEQYAPKSRVQTIPQSQQKQDAEPYLKQDFDGRTLFVSSVMDKQEQVRQLIGLLNAMMPMLPDPDRTAAYTEKSR